MTKIQLYRNFDNIGLQCGGWTVRWQGYQGNEFWADSNKISSNATSILDALKNLQKSSKVNIIIYLFSLLYITLTTHHLTIKLQFKPKEENISKI